MPWYPKAVRKPIARYAVGVRPAMRKHNRLQFHTAVSSSESLYPLMSNPGTATSHFYVREDGTVEQYANTSVQSSATLEGNDDCITVETWDGYGDSWNGSGPGPRWTKAQVDALADLAAWVHKVHGIPLRRCRSSRPGTRGIAWHRQGIDGNFPSGLLRGRVSGGEHWSYSFGKVCPTDTRIKQIGRIIRQARKGGGGGGLRVNRYRVNRALQQPGKEPSKYERKHIDAVVKALRKHGFTVEGYPQHLASVRRAIEKFQEHQGWKGSDADGLLGPTTCRLLGLRSRRGGGKSRKH